VALYHCECPLGIRLSGEKRDGADCWAQEGVIAIGFSILAAFILPNYPHTTKWLSTEEQAFAAWRLLQDFHEADDYKGSSVWTGALLAFKDYRLYIFVLMQHISLLSQSFQYFFPTIVGTLGYGRIITLWLTVPCWVGLQVRKVLAGEC
jgi:hypothetical protein